MPDDRGTDELASFLAQRGDHLMRSAVLLAGGRQAGEDLLQTAVGGCLCGGEGSTATRSKSAASRGLKRLHELAEGWRDAEWDRRAEGRGADGARI